VGKGFSINFFCLDAKEAKDQDWIFLPHILFFSFESAKLLRRFTKNVCFFSRN